jgi:hypothetical protein
MNVHFSTNFLVVGNDYFADRDAGYAAMDKQFARVSEQYVRAKTDAGPIDPIAQVSRQALVEQAVSAFGETQMRESAQAMQTIIDRYEIRTPVA